MKTEPFQAKHFRLRPELAAAIEEQALRQGETQLALVERILTKALIPETRQGKPS